MGMDPTLLCLASPSSYPGATNRLDQAPEGHGHWPESVCPGLAGLPWAGPGLLPITLHILLHEHCLGKSLLSGTLGEMGLGEENNQALKPF